MTIKIQQQIKINDFTIANNKPLTLIAGPCQIESLEHSLEIVDYLTKLTKKLEINFIFKSSFDKANRSSVTSQRGIGLTKAIPIFEAIKEKYQIPILTDIHNEAQATILGKVNAVDILQIPAFLCRQTDLLQSAANTNKIINIKKGQFLAPWDVRNIISKMEHFNNRKLLLTDRGTSFGYNTLISDMRGLKIMSDFGYPVIFDATHSVQQPGGQGEVSGGQREFVEILAKAATTVSIAGIFMETHEDPDNAPSDGPCMIKIDDLENLLIKLILHDRIAKSDDATLKKIIDK